MRACARALGRPAASSRAGGLRFCPPACGSQAVAAMNWRTAPAFVHLRHSGSAAKTTSTGHSRRRQPRDDKAVDRKTKTKPRKASSTLRQSKAAEPGPNKLQIAAKIVAILQKRGPTPNAAAPQSLIPPRQKATFQEGLAKFRSHTSTMYPRIAAREALGPSKDSRKLDPKIFLDLKFYEKQVSSDEIPEDLRAPAELLRSDRGSPNAQNFSSFGDAPPDLKAKNLLAAGEEPTVPRRRSKASRKSRGSTLRLDPRGLTLGKLARTLREDAKVLIDTLEAVGYSQDSLYAPWGAASPVTAEEAELVCLELDRDVTVLEAAAEESEAAMLMPRPPIVSIMGHVDHGKTTLLDNLRARAGGAKKIESIAASEAGGITQAISAFSVAVNSQDAKGTGSVTFLDTPGHAAFTGMRLSGATATDVAVVVIAGDDGVKPQTEEVLSMLKRQKVPKVVAMTKIDREDVDVQEALERIENQLIALEVIPESAGGDVPVIPLSGISGEGVENLLAYLNLQTESLDLKADETAAVDGWILEASMTKTLGPVATVLVKWGSVKAGDWVVCGDVAGRVRFLLDQKGKQIKGAVGPGRTARLVGFPSVPAAGTVVQGVESEEAAEALVGRRRIHEEELEMARSAVQIEKQQEKSDELRRAVLQEPGQRRRRARLSKQVAELAAKEAEDSSEEEGPSKLKVVIKADSKGTLDALETVITTLFDDSVATVEVVDGDVGEISESDVDLARVVGAPIAAFNVGFLNKQVQSVAEAAGVKVLRDKIIYHLAETVKDEFKRQIELKSDRVLGTGSVQMVIEINVKGRKKKQIAGCKVASGLFQNSGRTRIRVRREGEIVANAVRVDSLKHFKEDVSKVEEGKECGLGLAGFDDFQEGDEIECYEPKPKQATSQ